MEKILILLACLSVGCGNTQSSFKRSEITPKILKQKFSDKPYAVKLRFYISKNEMFEETGYVKSSGNDNTIIFEYFDSRDRKYVNVEIPLQNISSIAIASKDSESFSARQQLSVVIIAIMLLGGLSVMIL